MKAPLALQILALALTASAIAAPPLPPSGGGSSGPQKSLSFEELRAACRDPKRFQNQVQPTSIVIDCSDRALRWIPGSKGLFALPTKRVITHAVSSDKYRVSVTGCDVNSEPTPGECPTMKQIEETISLSEEITCDQIIHFEGTATLLCQQLLDELRHSNPNAVQTKETGKVVSFCRPDDGGPLLGGPNKPR
jgi:hypothetical protein